MLTRPSLAEMHDYRRDVDARMQQAAAGRASDAALRELVALGLNHEQQHQELLLTDVKHLLSLNPLAPAYRERAAPRHRWPRRSRAARVDRFRRRRRRDRPQRRRASPSTTNAAPRGAARSPTRLASRLVTNGEYLQFIEQGGYADPQLWLAEGWDWVNAEPARAAPVLAPR